MVAQPKPKLQLQLRNQDAPQQVSSWMNQFRHVASGDRSKAECWFWDHFNWNSQSLWIGKLNTQNHLPTDDEGVVSFMNKLIVDLNNYPSLRGSIYIKMYFSRNIKNKEPDINYLLVCNSPVLPPELTCSLVGIVFEKYQITEALTNKHSNFKNMINHYINWNNFYNYHDLIGELEF